MLSRRTKESIKTALAVVIAYAITFYFGWEKPFWAAFAVVMISLDTSGQSLNKAAMRTLGTVVAVCAALTFFALFPQERWALLFVLCAYLGFCAYMIAGPRRQYFWFVSAFVCLVIIIDGAPVSSDLFAIAMARFEETAMGIVVYSVVSILLWPQSSRGDLETSAQNLFETQVALYKASIAETAADDPTTNLQPVAIKEIQALIQFEKDLEAAIHDSYEVWEVRRQWRQYHALSQSLLKALGRWRASFTNARHLDLPGLLPNLETFKAEMAARADRIAAMLRGESVGAPPSRLTLEVALTEARALSHFDRAALAAFKSQLDQIEELSRTLFKCVADIKGFGTEASDAVPAAGGGFALDPDRLHASATVVATLVVAYCVWIYVDPPTHSLFVFLPTQWALASVLTRLPITKMVPGFLTAFLTAGIAYVFVMPHLSGFAELSVMLFLFVFGMFWLFFEPKRRMTRTGALANFLILISLENNQSYDFANFIGIVAGVSLSVGLAILIQYFPFSPRPEKVFLRLLGRYFRQLEFLLTRLSYDWERERGPFDLLRTMLYRSDILRIPVRLVALANQIDYRVLPGTSPQRIHDLAASLQAIALRINDLLDMREPERANPLVQELLGDLRDWRLAARDVVRHWAKDPGAAPPVDIEQRLADRIENMERRIGEAREKFDPEALSQAQYEGLYRAVAGFRGLSDAGVAYAGLASGIDWRPWKEARF